MSITVKTEGFEGLESALIELEQFSGRTTTGKNAVQRGMKKALKAVEDRAKQLAPKDDGYLAESITTKKQRAKRAARGRYLREPGVTMLTGPTGREEGGNAAFQEFGTVDMAANPYMRPAADAEGPGVVNEVASVLREEVMKSVARARKKAAKGK